LVRRSRYRDVAAIDESPSNLETTTTSLGAGPVRLTLSAREGPTPGTWRYSLGDGTDSRVQYGRVAGMTDHMDVLRNGAGICAAGYEPGTIERGLLEQFAADDMVNKTRPPYPGYWYGGLVVRGCDEPGRLLL
jgi:hypothetical protein